MKSSPNDRIEMSEFKQQRHHQQQMLNVHFNRNRMRCDAHTLRSYVSFYVLFHTHASEGTHMRISNADNEK